MAIMLQPLASLIVEKLLELVPEDTKVEPYRDANLNSWRTIGAYSLISSSSKSVELKVTQREYAAVLIAECHHLLNHTSEHRGILLGSLASSEDPSPSWKFVSFYYMALYLALSLSRVNNEAVIYLDKEGLSQYSKEPERPNAGTFIITHAIDPLTYIPKVSLKKAASSHFHEAAWVSVHKFMRLAKKSIESQTANRRPTEEEILSLRATKLFLGLSFRDAETWPSAFRNAVNYRPGYSYRSVLKHNLLPKHLGLKKRIFKNAEEAILFGEGAHRSLKRILHPADEPLRSLELLIVQSLILENVVLMALKELERVRRLECSAFRQRTAFNKINCPAESLLSMLPLQ